MGTGVEQGVTEKIYVGKSTLDQKIPYCCYFDIFGEPCRYWARNPGELVQEILKTADIVRLGVSEAKLLNKKPPIKDGGSNAKFLKHYVLMGDNEFKILEGLFNEQMELYVERTRR